MHTQDEISKNGSVGQQQEEPVRGLVYKYEKKKKREKKLIINLKIKVYGIPWQRQLVLKT